ncbi:RimL Acetyltransferases, including N-acetylases of ribosomal proteins [Candidatus Methylopumilus universalis]|uniref:GNAT family N-acetyltransferase n=1 Tax=Candidatus Methylopumilus universalis TaxID=2588536 RepID=UPI003BEF2A64
MSSIYKKRILIERFDKNHLKNPIYISWLSDKDNLISLNLIDYLINPVTEEKLELYFQSFESNSKNNLFALTLLETGQFIGTLTLREIGHMGLFDLGILIGEKSLRGKGLARESIHDIVNYAFLKLGARKITSSFPCNNYSVMLAFLKNEFRIEGLQRDQQISIDETLSDRYIVGLLSTDFFKVKQLAEISLV